MLEVSSLKTLASKSKGFDLWVELIALDLPSANTRLPLLCDLRDITKPISLINSYLHRVNSLKE